MWKGGFESYGESGAWAPSGNAGAEPPLPHCGRSLPEGSGSGDVHSHAGANPAGGSGGSLSPPTQKIKVWHGVDFSPSALVTQNGEINVAIAVS